MTIVTDYVREEKRRTRKPFVPLSHAPGHAQVNFGEAPRCIWSESRVRISRAWSAIRSATSFGGGVGVALVQALLVGAVLLFFGVPHAGLFSLGVFVPAILQVGARPLVVVDLIWFGMCRGASAEATIFSALIILAASTENILTPFVLGRGLETPLLVNCTCPLR